MKRYWLILVFYFVSNVVCPQTNPEDKLGTWFMYNGKHQLSEKFSINSGVQFRYYEPSTNYNLNLFYTGFNYHIGSQTFATFNYGYLDIDRSIEFSDVKNTIEHRFWEQIYRKHKLYGIALNHRLRLEHRFLHDHENTLQNRIRYRLGSSIPINSRFSFLVSNEFFVNLEGDPFRENRIYGALDIQIDKHVKINLGYLRQHINNLNLNRLQVGMHITTDLRKK
ncbi:DUF2490 domain-containing protein [Psychroserpens sp. XS_ASV72]|uniref:DUF2490 domain-containing protein n=1 Tax=Psychroserpens sp. XS_ASV72 TaxID=3241293 RepID=UPI003513CC84